jgi:hypothetical protein
VAGLLLKKALIGGPFMRQVFTSVFAAVVVLLASFSCSSDSPTEPTPAQCTYTLSASSLSFGASGGANSVTVTTASQCTWTAASDRAWMSVTAGASGTGNGSVSVSLTPNAGTAVRTGTLTVAGQAVSVRQDGSEPCSIDISPGSAAYNKDSATGAFTVTAPGSCAWSATSNASWLVVTSGSSGTGTGSVGYSVARNNDVAGRSGAIAVGERTFTVAQAGDLGNCEYSVTPIVFSPCMSVPYTLTATVTTQQGCTWTADPGASWITVTGGSSGSGSGTVSFRVSDNWEAPRQSVVKVRWPTPTAGQNLQVSQAGCFYAVSTSDISVAAAGGPGQFGVIQQSEPIICGGATQNACIWTAQASVGWITVTTPMPGIGDDRVSFTVAPNNTGAARIGTIVVRDKVVRITQAGN